MSEPEKKPESQKPDLHEAVPKAGILKEADKRRLESDIMIRLQKLGSELTKKDIHELLAVIETSKNLNSLKEKLTGIHKDVDEKVLTEILSIAESIQRWAIEGIRELRVDIQDVLRNIPADLKKGVFLSERFPGLARFEKSELWENIIVDIAGFAIGAVDSLLVIAELVTRLLVDIFYLPKDILNVRSRSARK